MGTYNPAYDECSREHCNILHQHTHAHIHPNTTDVCIIYPFMQFQLQLTKSTRPYVDGRTLYLIVHALTLTKYPLVHHFRIYYVNANECFLQCFSKKDF